MPSSPEINRIKVAASGYAKTFLAQKYSEEYSELYQAYLINRGVKVNRSPRATLRDEREILKARLAEEARGQ